MSLHGPIYHFLEETEAQRGIMTHSEDTGKLLKDLCPQSGAIVTQLLENVTLFPVASEFLKSVPSILSPSSRTVVLNQWVVTPLWVTYQISYMSDIYITICNSSKL